MIHLKLSRRELKGGILVIDIRSLCEPCANKYICKYTKKSFDLTENIKIEYPFFIEVKCKYFANIVPQPRNKNDWGM